MQLSKNLTTNVLNVGEFLRLEKSSYFVVNGVMGGSNKLEVVGGNDDDLKYDVWSR